MTVHIYAPVNNITAYLVTEEDASNPSEFITWLTGELPEGYVVELSGMGSLMVSPPEGDPTPVAWVYTGNYVWVHEGKVRLRPQAEFECYYAPQ